MTPRPGSRVASGTALAALVVALGCGGGSATSPADGRRDDVCRVTIVPPPGSSAPVPTLPGTSRAVAHVTLPLATLRRELEPRVPLRVAEDRDHDLGVAGRLQFVVDRGPFAIAVEGDSLVLRTPLRARAEACAKGRCYASCEPEATATVAVPLRLSPGYTFAPSRVSVAFTRGCQVRALGGFVRIDVTPIVEAAARAQLRRVEQEVDRHLPPVRPHAERLWSELDRARPMPVGCLDPHPEALVQGPSAAAGDAVRLRFALAARPEVRAACGAARGAKPLPPLAFDASMPPEGDLEVSLVSTFGAPALVRGLACPDDLRVHGTPVWADDGRMLRLAHASVDADDRARLAAMPGGAGAEQVEARVAEEVRLAPLLAPEGLVAALPLVASAVSSPALDVRIGVGGVAPSRVMTHGDEIRAMARVRGAIEIRPR